MTHWQTILAIDFDKSAAATYAANFPSTEVRCASVVDELDKLPYADVIVGGPPCQSFSVAGERKGDQDERNCIPDFIDAVKKVRPRMFLMENVDGLLSFADGRYAQKVFTLFEDAGYVVQVKTLDAVNFGVPQFRSRCWWWGIRKDLIAGGVRHLWPKETHQWPPAEEGMFGTHGLLPGVTVGQALHIWYPGCGWEEDGCGDVAIRRQRSKDYIRRDHPVNEPCPTIGTPTGGDGILRVIEYDHGVALPASPSPTIKAVALHPGLNPNGVTSTAWNFRESTAGANLDPGIVEYRWSDAMLAKHPPASPASPAPTVQAKYYKGGAEGLVEITDNAKHQPHQPANTLGAGGNGHGMSAANMHVAVDQKLSSEGRLWESHHPPATPAPTVRARSPRDGGRCTENVLRDGLMVRRLSPTECLRLQSGPDDFIWPEKITKTAKYRIIGNGWAARMGAVFSEAFRAADPNSKTVIDLFCGGGLGACGWHGKFWEYMP